ncbi:MAG: hypothetical protein MJZ15_11215 [Bacteroidales bacterium]|nr:hypothetical protein [Bacteroidales bacterium]
MRKTQPGDHREMVLQEAMRDLFVALDSIYSKESGLRFIDESPGHFYYEYSYIYT